MASRTHGLVELGKALRRDMPLEILRDSSLPRFGKVIPFRRIS
jgi:hypothetical protein